MDKTPSSLSQIRHIDNSHQNLPLKTFFVLIFLVVFLIWFCRGGSFRFYASLFFGLYYLTKNTWLSIVLVGVAQTIIFLPLRYINLGYHLDLKDFETELEKQKAESQQTIFYQRIRQGNSPVIFHMINFILMGVAFFSVGRIFFLDFYHHPINAAKFFYHFIPYPQYPLQQTTFTMPWVYITKTFAFSWSFIFHIWGIFFGFFIILRLIWILSRRLLNKNKQILNLRIQYNHFLVFIGSFTGSLFLFSLFFLRHIPINFHFITISADLTRQNTGFNIVTAVCTFLATIHAGFDSSKEAAIDARKIGVPEDVIKKVSRQKINKSFQNGFFLSLFALWITRLMPCSHDLSVLSFEFIYLVSPFTFDLLLKSAATKPKKVEQPITISDVSL